jgi:hypothetical protein
MECRRRVLEHDDPPAVIVPRCDHRTDFDLHLTASALAEAAETLTKSDPEKGPALQGASLMDLNAAAMTWPEAAALIGVLIALMLNTSQHVSPCR